MVIDYQESGNELQHTRRKVIYNSHRHIYRRKQNYCCI